jgi:hypothetical protein
VSNGDFIVIFQYSIAIPLENYSYTFHAEGSQLGRTKRTDAGTAEYVDSATHCP